MDIHENARTTRHSRMLMIDRLHSGWSVPAVAHALGVTAKTVRKWQHRFHTEGVAGLTDRSSRPHRTPTDRRAAGRGLGWEYLHVAIDDRSRLAFTQVLASERKEDATAFLVSSLAFFNRHGITVERVMTDNGSAYKSFAFRDALAAHGIHHTRTRPYTPRTNGKAERFIQSSIREWAYAAPFASSAERTAAMHPWLHNYNTARPHAALGGKPPISRLIRDNVLGRDRYPDQGRCP